MGSEVTNLVLTCWQARPGPDLAGCMLYAALKLMLTSRHVGLNLGVASSGAQGVLFHDSLFIHLVVEVFLYSSGLSYQ